MNKPFTNAPTVPALLDEDPVSNAPWPLPEPRAWNPLPRATVLERLLAIFFGSYRA
jgi:hypothetical protein